MRDGDYCYYCKDELDEKFHIDHMEPINRGGRHELSNFALACAQCNQEKYNKTIEEYRHWRRKNGLDVKF